MRVSKFVLSAAIAAASTTVIAGPYAPAAGQVGSTAVAHDSPLIKGWATGYTDYNVGTNVDARWQTPEQALGVAGNSDGTNKTFTYDIVTLGRGGEITITFDTPIINGEGADFAVFENSFNDTFLELAYVEVSSDNTNFFRFPVFSYTEDPVGGFGAVDPTNIDGFASKYRGGFGTPFDLDVFNSVDPQYLDINSITAIKLIDVFGDGSEKDDFPAQYGGPHPIYDPTPTVGSAGFDLDAIAVLNQGQVSEVPLPAGVWLFMSALSSLALTRKTKR